jgi:hypothetical protein
MEVVMQCTELWFSNRSLTRFVLTIVLICSFSHANDTTSAKRSLFSLNKAESFKPLIAIETWATYSLGEEKAGKKYTRRGDVSFRRFRFGGNGSPYSWLTYSFQMHLDRLGEDSAASTKGSYGDKPDIWNAYITAKLIKNTELLNIDAGYYWAAISREFNTSSWAVGSFDKTWANWYLRNFVTGKGNGIESGLGFGGLQNFGKFGISYRIGSYEPRSYSSRVHSDRLYTQRIMFSIGDPEQIEYRYMLPGNLWCKRTGVTIGMGFSEQAKGKLSDTLYFKNSFACGGDVLVSVQGLRIDGEYFLMNRTAEGKNDFDGSEWHIRTGYTFAVGKTMVEPCASYDAYEGKGNRSLYKYIGNDATLDIGVNWYLNKDKLKVALHYVNQDGTVAMNSGDYIGLSFLFRL